MRLNYYLKEIKEGISNLLYYFKVIWRDRNWDHAYMDAIVLAKYKRWYKVYSGDIPLDYVGRDKDLQAMRILIEILERRKSDFYTEIWHSRYGHKIKYDFEPSTDSKLFILKSRGLTEEEEKLSSELLKASYRCEIRDWKSYSQITEKYYNKFWD